MRPRRLARHTHRATNALVLVVCALLLATTPAAARVANDAPLGTPAAHAQTAPRPIIIKDTLARDNNGGLGTLGFALITVGAVAALLGAGYLGARIASNHSHHPAT